MAGHGGGGGGHGGGGGGGGGSKGRLSGIMGNGCLRYLFLYIIGLLLILGFLGASALGLFRRLPIPLPSLPVASGSSTVASANLPAAPAAAAAAPAAAAPPAVAAAPPAGQAAGTGSTGAQSTGGGSTATAPGMGQLQSLPLMGAQGVTIIPYIVPAFYVVQPSDTLAIIADKYGTTAAAIHSYNGLSSDALRVGQILYLPPPAYNPVPSTGRNAHP